MKDEICVNETALAQPAVSRHSGARISRLVTRYWAEGVIVAIALLLWAPRLSGPIDLRWDGSVYYILGTSLATGHGYRILSEPGSPEALQYPPLLPVVVALYQRALGTTDPTVVARWLRISYAVLFLVYAFVVLTMARRYVRPWLALAAAALCLLQIHTVFLSDLLFAELPFAVVSVVFVLVTVNGVLASRPWLREAASFALAAAGFLLRTIGVVLLAAWVFDAITRYRWRLAIGRAALALMPIVLWQVHLDHARTSYEYTHPAYAYQRAPYQYYNVSYIENVLLIDPFRPELGRLNPRALATRLMANLPGLVAAVGEAVSTRIGYWHDFLKDAQHHLGSNTVIPKFVRFLPSDVLAAVILVGLVILVRRGIWLIVFIVLGSIGLVWVTPWPGQFDRYLMPLSPFLAVCVLLPIASTVNTSLGLRQRWVITFARVFLASLLVLAFAAEGYALLQAFRKRNKKEAVVIPQTGGTGYRLFYHDDSWQAWEQAADWIGTHARSDAIVATTAPHFFYLRTGHRAVLPPMEPDLVRAAHLLEGVPVSYVIVDQLQFLDLSRRYALPAVKSDPIGWRLVYSIHFRHRPGWLKPADFAYGTQVYQRVTDPR
jgi:hypothetical protein